MRRADMYAGLIIIAVAAAFGAGSLAMPWKESEWGIYAAPGLVPLLLSVLLIITGLVLVIRSVTAKGFYEGLEKAAAADVAATIDESEDFSEKGNVSKAVPEWKRIVLTIFLVSIYIFILLGRLPYMLATGIFVAVFILAFRGGGIVKAVLTGGLTAVAVWLVFEKIFIVRLP